MSPQGKRLTMICASLVLLQIMFAVHRFAQGAEGKVLKIDRPLAAGGFLSLTGPLAPRVVVSPLRAMLMKSALRDLLSVSYGMISILRIGSLRSPPPFRLRSWTHLRCEGS